EGFDRLAADIRLAHLERQVERAEASWTEVPAEPVERRQADGAVAVPEEPLEDGRGPRVLRGAERPGGLEPQAVVGVVVSLLGEQVDRGGVVPAGQGVVGGLAAAVVVLAQLVAGPVQGAVGPERDLAGLAAGV